MLYYKNNPTILVFTNPNTMKKFSTIILTLTLAACTSAQTPGADTSDLSDESTSTDVVSTTEVSTQTPWVMTAGQMDDFREYEGLVDLKGWIIDKNYYVEDIRPHFHVADESVASLPGGERFRDFVINVTIDGEEVAAPDEVISELRSATESSPITVKADKITVHLEGSPYIHLADY